VAHGVVSRGAVLDHASSQLPPIDALRPIVSFFIMTSAQTMCCCMCMCCLCCQPATEALGARM
jgi:hypothetical protein